MNQLLSEQQVTCPACWEPHTVLIDLSGEEQSLIEDCTVCCNPMEISFEVAGDTVQAIHAEPLS
ncbi:MAG: CPXCG motif-containing cysteine-rich protein [Gammaproteobacteria bacterium]|nr:CPXCG motif-containing cysteine-rich protein [Gammaproteobacteria bacterium]